MIFLVISPFIAMFQKCQKWVSVDNHLLRDFYKLTVHAKELKDRLENMDKKNAPQQPDIANGVKRRKGVHGFLNTFPLMGHFYYSPW